MKELDILLRSAFEDEAFRQRFIGIICDYLGNLKREGIRDPLGESLLVGAVLSDLFTLAGIAAPAAIAERIG